MLLLFPHIQLLLVDIDYTKMLQLLFLHSNIRVLQKFDLTLWLESVKGNNKIFCFSLELMAEIKIRWTKLFLKQRHVCQCLKDFIKKILFFCRSALNKRNKWGNTHQASPPSYGWAFSWWNNCSFPPRTNGTIKNDPIILKKSEHLESVLQNIGTISKRTELNGAGIA